jgi:hypothetical protein
MGRERNPGRNMGRERETQAEPKKEAADTRAAPPRQKPDSFRQKAK